MLIKRPRPGDSARIAPSQSTPDHAYLNRRELLQAALAAGLGTLAPVSFAAAPRSLEFVRNARYVTDEKATSYEDITTYNNFYEFGTAKSAPAANSGG